MNNLLKNPGVLDTALKFNVDQYHRLCDSGIVSERTELLEGVIVGKMGKSPLHTWTVGFLAEWFRTGLRDGLHFRVEQPLTLERSEPEPDLAIVVGTADAYRAEHPQTAHLVVEVAITSQELDLAKSIVYAAAGIPEYWLIEPEENRVTVFRDPSMGGYRTSAVLNADGALVTAVCTAELRLAKLFAE